MANPFLNESLLDSIRREKREADTAEEMCRRVGLHDSHGRRYLTIERIVARRQGRPVDLTHVAWAIKFRSQGRPERG